MNQLDGWGVVIYVMLAWVSQSRLFLIIKYYFKNWTYNLRWHDIKYYSIDEWQLINLGFLFLFVVVVPEQPPWGFKESNRYAHLSPCVYVIGGLSWSTCPVVAGNLLLLIECFLFMKVFDAVLVAAFIESDIIINLGGNFT